MTSFWSKHTWFRRTISTLVSVLTACIVVLLSIAYIYMPPEGRTHTPAYLRWMQTHHLCHYVEAGNFHLHSLHKGSGEAVILLPGGGAWIYDLPNVIATLAPHARIVEIDQAGHLVQDDQPELVNHLLLHFLASAR